MVLAVSPRHNHLLPLVFRASFVPSGERSLKELIDFFVSACGNETCDDKHIRVGRAATDRGEAHHAGRRDRGAARCHASFDPILRPIAALPSVGGSGYATGRTSCFHAVGCIHHYQCLLNSCEFTIRIPAQGREPNKGQDHDDDSGLDEEAALVKSVGKICKADPQRDLDPADH